MSFRSFLCTVSVCVLAACSGQSSPPASTSNDTNTPQSTPPVSAGELNLYSSRHYDTDERLYSNFTAQTGIEINRIEAGADALIERIKSEGEFSPADILITVDAGRLWRAEEAGIFAPLSSEVLTDNVPAHLRHPDGLWYGMSKRARVIIYNKAAGKPDNLETYEDLARADHKGKICIRSSSNIYNISLMASIVSRQGPEKAQDWAENVVSNFARDPQSNDTGQIEAVASGACGIAVVNTYYLARLKASDDPERRAIGDKVGVIFPNQGETGTHVNISGAGLVKHAPNRDNAVRFLEYLTEQQSQSYFANGNHEYPVVANVDTGSALRTLGAFQEDEINASELGKNQSEAVRVFDRAGWK